MTTNEECTFTHYHICLSLTVTTHVAHHTGNCRCSNKPVS